MYASNSEILAAASAPRKGEQLLYGKGIGGFAFSGSDKASYSRTSGLTPLGIGPLNNPNPLLYLLVPFNY
jgi:hypothetical protein